MNFVGAKWWKFDLHTHSPASFDYGKGDTDLSNTKSPKDWLLDYIAQSIECVAVTDHNTGQWIDGLKEAAQILREEGQSIHVFPGVEITANSNIHVLGIFDPTCTSADINAIVGASKFRGKKGDSDEVAEESAENIIKEILNYGGIAIPAHIDMKTGLCQQPSALTIQQICNNASAVEIIFPDQEREDAPLSKYLNLNIDLPSVIGSDSHHPNKIGRAYTWVKMSTPSIEGLKLALVDGSSSIIRSDKEVSNPNQASNTLLHSVKIEQSKYAGRSDPFEIEFNPWLNSIIGGRGSGKSSVLEFIRIGMDRSRDLLNLNPNNEVRRSFESFIKLSTSRESEGVMLNNTKITCMYTRDGIHYLLQWLKESNTVSILRNDNGIWIPEEGDVYSRFPIKIFSQKQIFDLAKNPNALLRLIDDSSTVSCQQWRMNWEEQCSHFQTLCSQKRELQSRLSNKNTLLGQLADIEQKIKTIENSGHKNILSSYQRFQVKRLGIIQYETDIENLKNQVNTIFETVSLPEVDITGYDVKSNNELEVAQKLADLSQKLIAFKASITTAINLMGDELAEFKDWYARSEFNSSHISINEQYNKLIEELKNKGINSPSDYAKLISDREVINKSLKDFIAIETQINEFDSQIYVAYQLIIDARKQLTLNRRNFLNQYLSNNDAIKIDISPLCDIDELEKSFRSVIGRSDGSFSAELFDSDRETGFLFNLNRKLISIATDDNSEDLEQWFSLIHQFKVEVFNYGSGTILETKVGKRFVDFMEQQQTQMFDAINLWFPEDKLTIKFNDGHRFKDVSQGSAGQKASAILSFLLSYGTEPLILDQPEDDLDNGLITNLIVSKLHENKASRQIIIVTHNPNIVVNGDSEYVVALEDKGQIIAKASGALQEIDVRKNVCEILEGGEQALHQRYKRMFNI
jgi:histidinol phosphatase-like PHP family hydrolase/DNA repair ATPase RecN